MSDIPSGFVLDQPAKSSSLPAGFVLDAGKGASPAASLATSRPTPARSQEADDPDYASRVAMEAPDYVPPYARGDTIERNKKPIPVSDSPPPSPAGKPWAEVASEAAENSGASAAHFASALIAPIMHPIDTATTFTELAKGIYSKLSNPNPELRNKAYGKAPPTESETEQKNQSEGTVSALAEFYKDRYGTMEGFKKSLASDPVGVLADIATFLSLGSGAAARVPGAIGRIGEIGNRVGAAIEPVTLAGNAIKGTAKLAEVPASTALGVTTGAGTESVRTAARAGREGGEIGEAFAENMRGTVPIENIVDLAKSGLDKIRRERGAEYRTGMADISKDRAILDFNDINGAIGKAGEIGTFKGANIAPAASDVNESLRKIVRDWETLDPKSPLFKDVPAGELTAANFHTPEGMDALKRTIGNIRDATEYGSPGRVAADRVYNAVKQEIISQAPAYGKIMEKYEAASDKLKEVGKTFSLGEKATGDTAARKLQSATRDGAQTNWRQRSELLGELAAQEPTLPGAIAGQSLNAWAPRGLVARGGGMMAAGTVGPGVVANPLAAVPLAAFSPRVVGETVYFGGRAVGGVEQVAQAFGITPERVRLTAMGAFQGGRAKEASAREVAHKIMAADTVDDAIAAADEFTRTSSPRLAVP